MSQTNSSRQVVDVGGVASIPLTVYDTCKNVPSAPVNSFRRQRGRVRDLTCRVCSLCQRETWEGFRRVTVRRDTSQHDVISPTLHCSSDQGERQCL